MIKINTTTKFLVITLLICSKKELHTRDRSSINNVSMPSSSQPSCDTHRESNVKTDPKFAHHVHDLSSEAAARMSSRHLKERKQELRDRVKIAALKTRVWLNHKLSYTKDALAIGLDNVKQAVHRVWVKTKTGTSNTTQKIKNFWKDVGYKLRRKKDQAAESIHASADKLKCRANEIKGDLREEGHDLVKKTQQSKDELQQVVHKEIK